MPSEPPQSEVVRFRARPCEDCAERTEFIRYIIGRHEASGPLPGGSPDEIVDQVTARERPWLLDWARTCPHREWMSEPLHRLDEGSEHIVYYAPREGEDSVIKVTKPGIYGDIYRIHEGRVFQKCSTPTDYLLRLSLIGETFGFTSKLIGFTEISQIVTLQKFITGEPPTQQETDDYLLGLGLEPVKQNCWIWRKCDPADGAEY